MPDLSFKIYTLGCKVNQYDSLALSQELMALGWQLAGKGPSRVAIVNSCAVTKTAIHKAKRTLKKARAENQRAKIVLFGCWPQAYGLQAADVGADLVWGTGNLGRLAAEIDKMFARPAANGCQPAAENSGLLSKAHFKARYFLKIQDGCDQFCTYCLIPYARGRLTSRQPADIIAEVKAAEQAGWREIVLSGIHLGLWGKEKKQPLDLASLLSFLVSQTSVRFRLSSIEITEVSDELIKLMAENKSICPHLHIPLQSASNRILKLMNRPYDRQFFSQRLKYIRRRIPDIALTTDVMVGFPSETEADFLATYNFIRQAHFSRLHVFPFSAHNLVPAAHFGGQVKASVKQQRARILRQLGAELKKQYLAQFKGKILTLLVEKQANNKFIGKSQYYFDVEFSRDQIAANDFKGKRNLVGKLVKIKL